MSDPEISSTTRSASFLDNQADHNLETARSEFRIVSELGRWAYGKPAMYPRCPSAVAIAELRKAKHERIGVGDDAQTIWTTADVSLARCMSGRALLAGVESGALWPFPLRQRGVAVCVPVGARWKLRGSRLALLGLFVLAHVLGYEGLVAKHDELAAALGLRNPDHLADLVAELRAWGLVVQDGTWVQHGRARSRRGNVYRITTLAVHAFGLQLDTARLPAPDTDTAPRIARTRTRAGAPGVSPTHPENTCGADTDPAETAISLPSSAADVGGVESPPATVDFPSAVPDEAACPSDLGRVKAWSETSSEGPVEAAARRTGDAVRDVVPGTTPSKRRSEPYSESDRERQRHEYDVRKAGRIREQAERAAERARVRDVPPAGVAPELDAWGQAARAALDEQRREDLARYKAQLEADELARQNRPVQPRPRPPVDDDIADVIERAWETRWGKPTGMAELTLREMRKGGAS